MAWYRSGTLSVTNGSTSVTGAGTSWIAGAGIGEALYAPDGRIYEIANISSNTSLTLATAYLGTTQSAQSYTIIPSQSYIRDLAADAAALISQYAGIASGAGAGKFTDGTVSTPGIAFASDVDTGIYHPATNTLGIAAGGINQMQVGTAGVNIGTLSANPVISAGTANGVTYLNASKQLTSGSALTFDGTNLGIGVTPSAWQSTSKGVDVAQNAFISGANAVDVLTNAYKNSGGSWVYKSNGPATLFSNYNSAFTWNTAPSGTAGAAISFTQAMTLDARGNLLVGTTSNPGSGFGGELFVVNTGGNVALLRTTAVADVGVALSCARVSNGLQISFHQSGSYIGGISTNSTATAYITSSDYRLKNITGPITNSGQYIDSLNPVEGTWKADGSTFVGLIAHEVQEVSRTQVATGEKDGEQMQAMDYSNSELIANLIAEVKSLRARVAALESN